MRMARAIIIGIVLALSLGWFTPLFIIHPLAVPATEDATPGQLVLAEVTFTVACWPIRLIPPEAWDRVGERFGLGAVVATIYVIGPAFGWGLAGAAIGAAACAIARRRRETCPAS